MPKMKAKHILIVGDLMLDKYIYGSSSRKSPEANVPVVLQEKTMSTIGGAGNVASTISNFGYQCTLLACIGDDSDGVELSKLIQQTSINGVFLKESNRPTTAKKRIIVNQTHQLRVDHEKSEDLEVETIEKICHHFESVIAHEEVSFVIFQDYNKGVLNEKTIKFCTQILHSKKIPFAVDPKVKNYRSYCNAAIFKPNRNEFLTSLGLTQISIAEIAKNASTLRKEMNIEIVVVTLGESGIFIQNRDKSILIDGYKHDSIDVCGAGDAVLALLVDAYCNGDQLEEMGAKANLAGFMSCLKVGVHPLIQEEFANSWRNVQEDIKIKYV